VQRVWCKRTAGLPDAKAMAGNAALFANVANGGRGVNRSDHRVGQQVWALRLPSDHGAVAGPSLGCRQGPRAAHLADRRVESAAETKGARQVVAKRRVVRAAAGERANHVWSYDFVSAMTHDGRTLWTLTLIDEYTRECLAIRVIRRLGR
jgi:hypothetical protein